MKIRGRKMSVLLIGIASVGGGLWVRAQTSQSNQDPTPPRAAGQPIIQSNADIIALHDARSRQYNPNCLSAGCHADIFDRTTLDSSIRAAHNTVERMGLSANDCRSCHESTEIVNGIRRERGNAGKLGKQVDPVLKCFPCHGSAGPGKQLYAR